MAHGVERAAGVVGDGGVDVGVEDALGLGQGKDDVAVGTDDGVARRRQIT